MTRFFLNRRPPAQTQVCDAGQLLEAASPEAVEVHARALAVGAQPATGMATRGGEPWECRAAVGPLAPCTPFADPPAVVGGRPGHRTARPNWLGGGAVGGRGVGDAPWLTSGITPKTRTHEASIWPGRGRRWACHTEAE